MPAPFGGHPKLSRLIDWLVSAGCKAEIKVRNHTITGQPYRSLEITGPAGSRVVLADPDLNEYLTPSMVSYFQRRLGMQTPFPGVPEQPDSSEYIDEDPED